VVEDELKLTSRSSKAGSLGKIAIITALFAGGLLLALLFGFRGAIAPQVAVHAPAIDNSKLYQKIYECYKSRTMRRGADGILYFEEPTKITILAVEQREKGNPRHEGTPYYARVRIRFEDGIVREDDEWAFFVKDDKSVWYTTWATIAWSNFALDAIEDKLPPLKTGRSVKP